ncbi:MAG TPA: chemotaxis response regulator protein-glutamate methylesterase [Clostridiales bacterium]|jgi:two-component system chemotaxis response regulator CheB|nr:chemotaxis response regulator protein-glutamate methylesterase [Clostridiales bacterium]
MPIRVLVVDDSVLFRTKMQLSLSDSEITVVGGAANTTEAMQKILELNPDVVTLDVEMPGMNGIDFLKELLPRKSVPVVVVSSLPINALDALDAGAVDFVRKPSAGVPNAQENFLHEMREKIKIASKAKVRPFPARSARPADLFTKALEIKARKDVVIAIGASTGGTEAIIEVVKDLPPSSPGILVVQHMPANFTRLYAQRLDKICKMEVKEAVDYDRLTPGRIIVAAGDYHMTLKKDADGYYIRSRQGEKVSGHCPSVDVLFDSTAEVAGKNVIGVLLTGMGSDGARGLLKIRRQGGYTIGQDKESCVVYGMPMEAKKLGAVIKELPVEQIASEIANYLAKKK